MRKSLSTTLIWATVIFVGASCGGDAADATSVLVTFETPSGSFIARIDDPVSIDRAREALTAGGSGGIPNGRIVEGDGGVNVGHNGISRTSNWSM